MGEIALIDASVFNGPFAVYRHFVPSVNQWGEPKSYCPVGSPAFESIISLISSCLQEVKNDIAREKELLVPGISASHFNLPKTLMFGFRKGGTVFNQLVTELGFAVKPSGDPPLLEEKESGLEDEIHIISITKQSLLNSIREIHYVDVGLNSPGAYVTDHSVIENISECLIQGARGISFSFMELPGNGVTAEDLGYAKKKTNWFICWSLNLREVEGNCRCVRNFIFLIGPQICRCILK